MANHYTPFLIFTVEVGILVYMVHWGMELLTENCLKVHSVNVSKVDTRPHIITAKDCDVIFFTLNS